MFMRSSVSLIFLTLLAGCTTTPPEELENVCDIFQEKKGWYKKARRASRRWGTSIPVMMSFVHQESKFRAKAKPPRKKILWVIPGPRPASAYGYAQATDETWRVYKKSTGKWAADRNDFDDAMDFIGWYNDQSQRKNKIKKSDAYHLYLAYHEGQGGYAKRTYKKKKWLTDVAKKVSQRSNMYGKQLNGCEKKLNRGFFGRLFS
ncbi:MAG: hypothetical protein CMQ20_12235 [Gammaproteobacteria bacterium]|nr:hypothetical protein [Gammaproteobacteria bacterium]